MKTTSSHSSIVGTRFVIISVVISDITFFNSFRISSSVEASTADKASSNTRILGFLRGAPRTAWGARRARVKFGRLVDREFPAPGTRVCLFARQYFAFGRKHASKL